MLLSCQKVRETLLQNWHKSHFENIGKIEPEMSKGLLGNASDSFVITLDLSSYFSKNVFFSFFIIQKCFIFWWQYCTLFKRGFYTSHFLQSVVFHGFGQAKFAYGGLILGSGQFTPLPQLPLNILLNLKVVKIN